MLSSSSSFSGQELHSSNDIALRIAPNYFSFSRYDQAPECAYSSSQLDFAIHVRLGDRAELSPADGDDYFRLLEAFMEVVTKRVVDKTRNKLVFHIFSETLLPCPSSQNGTFEEFPFWKVEIDQVRVCFHGIKIPHTFLGYGRAGSSCPPRARFHQFLHIYIYIILYVYDV